MLAEKKIAEDGSFSVMGTGDDLKDIALTIHHKCNNANACFSHTSITIGPV